MALEKGEEASHLSQVDQLQLSTVVVRSDHKADLHFHLQTPETSSLLNRSQVGKVMSIRRLRLLTRQRQAYFFLTTDCYVCSLYARIRIRTLAFLLFLINCMASLVVNPTDAASRCDHSPTVILRPSSSTLRTVHTHQTSSKATAKTVLSDDRNTGTRQTPKVSSAIANIYRCRILAEVQLAHDRRQIMVQTQGGGRVLLRAYECVPTDWGTVHPTPPHASSSYDSTQLHTTPHNSTQSHTAP